MQTIQGNLFTRDDTFLGVCEGLGQDLGFNPNWLRAAIALLLFWNPVATAWGYAGAGAVVLLSRLIFPNPKRSPAALADEGAPIENAEPEPEQVPLAA